MTQEYDTTTERSSGFQGLGGGAYQQALCNSGRIALLASIIPRLEPYLRKFPMVTVNRKKTSAKAVEY